MSDNCVYSLHREDLQNVAQDFLSRTLTDSEMEKVEDVLSNYIDWYSAIENSIQHVIDIQ